MLEVMTPNEVYDGSQNQTNDQTNGFTITIRN